MQHANLKRKSESPPRPLPRDHDQRSAGWCYCPQRSRLSERHGTSTGQFWPRAEEKMTPVTAAIPVLVVHLEKGDFVANHAWNLATSSRRRQPESGAERGLHMNG